MKECQICGSAIDAERLARWPHVVTCSETCSDERTRRSRNAANIRWLKKRRERVKAKQEVGNE